MIYLITGGMGVGKTSLAVEMILNNYEGLFKYETEDGALIDRPLFFCHIDGLDRNKFKAHELTEEQIQSAPLNEIMPNGGVLIVDECDYTYPRRPPSREVPSYVQTLKELRHEGFTLILMTQHPSMLDIYVRQLVNKHIHLERKPIGTKRYEWFGCEENLHPVRCLLRQVNGTSLLKRRKNITNLQLSTLNSRKNCIKSFIYCLLVLYC